MGADVLCSWLELQHGNHCAGTDRHLQCENLSIAFYKVLP